MEAPREDEQHLTASTRGAGLEQEMDSSLMATPGDSGREAYYLEDRGESSLMAAPQDRGSEAYYLFFLLGAGFLLPWNAFITAVDYFSVLYPAQPVDTLFAVAYMVPNLVVLATLIVYLGRTPSKTIISTGYFTYFLLIALVPFLDTVTVGPDGLGTTLSFTVTMAAVAISGVVDALIQGSLFGMAAELPPTYTQALTGGVGASGLATSCLRILTKLILPGTEWGLRWSAYLYFSISAAVLLVCVWAYRRLNSLPLIQHNQSRRSFTALATDAAPLLTADGNGGRRAGKGSPATAAGAPLMSGSGSAESEASAGTPKSGEPVEDGMGMGMGTGMGMGVGMDSGEQELVDAERAGRAKAKRGAGLSGFLRDWFYLDALTIEGKAMSVRAVPPGQHFEVLGIVWPYATSLILVYFVTLSIFPGFISELKAEALGSWYPVLLMTSFNLFDFIGKMMPTVFMIENDSLLFALVAGRFLFYPLYSACLGLPSGSAFISQGVIPLLTSVLGLSNGLLTSLLMMAAPAVVPEEQAEATGTIMVLFLVIGLTLGALGGYFWSSFHL